MFKRFCIGLAVVASLAVSGLASAQSQLHIVDMGAWGQQPFGGPFEVEPSNFGFDPIGLGRHGAGEDTFMTFCLEVTERLSEGSTYDVTFSESAQFQNDPLDSRTAFLYKHFIDGTIDSIVSNFTYESKGSAVAMQRAIWFLEDEVGSVSGLSAQLVAAAQAAVDSGSWVGLGGVRVMNVWVQGHIGEEGFGRQDQLVFVPIPNAAALGLVGLLAVAFIGRRRLV